MNDISYDAHGVPILNFERVNEIADNFLGQFSRECLEIPKATPLEVIIDSLQNSGKARFVFNLDLGCTSTGRKYLGRYHIPSRTIFIDRTLIEGDHRVKFTIAHELGHFVLHNSIKTDAIKSESNELDIKDTDEHIILERLYSDNKQFYDPRYWIEWQANKFAGSLLLPQSTIRKAVIYKQKEFNIYENLGQIDESQFYGGELNAIIDYLHEVYGASRMSILVRLKELRIIGELKQNNSIETKIDEGPKHISFAMMDFLKDLENKMK